APDWREIVVRIIILVATLAHRRLGSSDMTPNEPTVAIEPDQAKAVFVDFAADGELALNFPADGCYARTHLMVQRLLNRSLVPSKVWAFAASATDLLWTYALGYPDGRVQWGYHVAPALFVRMPDGNTLEVVLDPLLFDRPVPVDVWRIALHDTPTLVR